MDPRQKAIEIIEGLSEERVMAAIKILEIIAGAGEKINNIMNYIALKAFEASCEEEDITPEEIVFSAEKQEKRAVDTCIYRNIMACASCAANTWWRQFISHLIGRETSCRKELNKGVRE
jgi:hypothetical protein